MIKSELIEKLAAENIHLTHAEVERVDFSKLEWVLVPENPATEAVEKVAIQYGAFINTLIQFLIVAFVVFLLVKGINKLRREQAPEAAGPTATEALLAEIRDELKARP
jgi:large conductance mechanosensitive channel